MRTAGLLSPPLSTHHHNGATSHYQHPGGGGIVYRYEGSSSRSPGSGLFGSVGRLNALHMPTGQIGGGGSSRRSESAAAGSGESRRYPGGLASGAGSVVFDSGATQHWRTSNQSLSTGGGVSFTATTSRPFSGPHWTNPSVPSSDYISPSAMQLEARRPNGVLFVSRRRPPPDRHVSHREKTARELAAIDDSTGPMVSIVTSPNPFVSVKSILRSPTVRPRSESPCVSAGRSIADSPTRGPTSNAAMRHRSENSVDLDRVDDRDTDPFLSGVYFVDDTDSQSFQPFLLEDSTASAAAEGSAVFSGGSRGERVCACGWSVAAPEVPPRQRRLLERTNGNEIIEVAEFDSDDKRDSQNGGVVCCEQMKQKKPKLVETAADNDDELEDALMMDGGNFDQYGDNALTDWRTSSIGRGTADSICGRCGLTKRTAEEATPPRQMQREMSFSPAAVAAVVKKSLGRCRSDSQLGHFVVDAVMVAADLQSKSSISNSARQSFSSVSTNSADGVLPRCRATTAAPLTSSKKHGTLFDASEDESLADGDRDKLAPKAAPWQHLGNWGDTWSMPRSVFAKGGGTAVWRGPDSEELGALAFSCATSAQVRAAWVAAVVDRSEEVWLACFPFLNRDKTVTTDDHLHHHHHHSIPRTPQQREKGKEVLERPGGNKAFGITGSVDADGGAVGSKPENEDRQMLRVWNHHFEGDTLSDLMKTPDEVHNGCTSDGGDNDQEEETDDRVTLEEAVMQLAREANSAAQKRLMHNLATDVSPTGRPDNADDDHDGRADEELHMLSESLGGMILDDDDDDRDTGDDTQLEERESHTEVDGVVGERGSCMVVGKHPLSCWPRNSSSECCLLRRQISERHRTRLLAERLHGGGASNREKALSSESCSSTSQPPSSTIDSSSPSRRLSSQDPVVESPTEMGANQSRYCQQQQRKVAFAQSFSSMHFSPQHAPSFFIPQRCSSVIDHSARPSPSTYFPHSLSAAAQGDESPDRRSAGRRRANAADAGCYQFQCIAAPADLPAPRPEPISWTSVSSPRGGSTLYRRPKPQSTSGDASQVSHQTSDRRSTDDQLDTSDTRRDAEGASPISLQGRLPDPDTSMDGLSPPGSSYLECVREEESRSDNTPQLAQQPLRFGRRGTSWGSSRADPSSTPPSCRSAEHQPTGFCGTQTFLNGGGYVHSPSWDEDERFLYRFSD